MNWNVQAIKSCEEVRTITTKFTLDILLSSENLSEKSICNRLAKAMANQPELLEKGWYSPPPLGISLLLASPGDIKRLHYDSLRKEEYWPREDIYLNSDSIGLIYLSPVHKGSGIIGDQGFTFYRGGNEEVRKHIRNCLNAIEEAADQAVVGMKLRELNDKTQKIFDEHGVNNNRMVTYHDKIRINLGHTIPWSYETASDQELEAIKTANISELKDIISSKRVYINSLEEFRIPKTIGFTLEARLESNTSPHLPNVFFHEIVTFRSGKKKVLNNYNYIFDTLGMHYLKSRF